jgi:hypothetical protein
MRAKLGLWPCRCWSMVCRLPESLPDGRLLFHVALPAQEIRIISGSARPIDFGHPVDQRRLGVALLGLSWEQDGETLDTPIDSSAFIDGFQHVEQPATSDGMFRWTNGNAALPPSPVSTVARRYASLSEPEGMGRELSRDAARTRGGGAQRLRQPRRELRTRAGTTALWCRAPAEPIALVRHHLREYCSRLGVPVRGAGRSCNDDGCVDRHRLPDPDSLSATAHKCHRTAG